MFAGVLDHAEPHAEGRKKSSPKYQDSISSKKGDRIQWATLTETRKGPEKTQEDHGDPAQIQSTRAGEGIRRSQGADDGIFGGDGAAALVYTAITAQSGTTARIRVFGILGAFGVFGRA